MLKARKILGDPDQLPRRTRPVGNAEKEPRRCGIGSPYFMESACDEAAAQNGICVCVTERGAPACLVFPKDGMEELSGPFQLFEYRSHLILFSLCSNMQESKG
jgi:hypothetical protein